MSPKIESPNLSGGIVLGSVLQCRQAGEGCRGMDMIDQIRRVKEIEIMTRAAEQDSIWLRCSLKRIVLNELLPLIREQSKEVVRVEILTKALASIPAHNLLIPSHMRGMRRCVVCRVDFFYGEKYMAAAQWEDPEFHDIGCMWAISQPDIGGACGTEG